MTVPGSKWGDRALNLIEGMTFFCVGFPLSPVAPNQSCLLSWLVSLILIKQNAKSVVLKVQISVYRCAKVELFFEVICSGFHFGFLFLHPPRPLPTTAGASCSSQSPGWSVQAADLFAITLRQSPPPRPLQGSASEISILEQNERICSEASKVVLLRTMSKKGWTSACTDGLETQIVVGKSSKGLGIHQLQISSIIIYLVSQDILVECRAISLQPKQQAV